MNYIRPTYDVQIVETSDIMLVSLGDGITDTLFSSNLKNLLM